MVDRDRTCQAVGEGGSDTAVGWGVNGHAEARRNPQVDVPTRPRPVAELVTIAVMPEPVRPRRLCHHKTFNMRSLIARPFVLKPPTALTPQVAWRIAWTTTPNGTPDVDP